jgi:hypothetical protein
VFPNITVMEASAGPKFKPLSVMVLASVCGAFHEDASVSTGASYEKTDKLLPTVSLSVSATLSPL